uniref:Putative ovule protein n=1 Tax=Solanum chacoense TaxID=4108 RepID=A0A0V0GUG5_SOLCH
MRFSFLYLSHTWDSLTAKFIQKFGKDNLTKLVNIIIMYNKSYKTKLDLSAMGTMQKSHVFIPETNQRL